MSDATNLSERIEVLETRLTFQDETIEALNKTITAQWQQIDARNSFEVALGSFEGALDPGIGSFGQFKEFAAHALEPSKHKKIAMFCTGGIRCEKASSYLLSRGFAEVYHLRGGILKYLEGVPEAQSRWRGECFVFDDRVALGHGLRERRMERDGDD